MDTKDYLQSLATHEIIQYWFVPTVAAAARVHFSSLQLQVLEEAHLFELTRCTRKGHNS